MAATVLVRHAWHNRSGIPKDDIVNDWCFKSATKLPTDAIPDLTTPLSLFYDAAGSYTGACVPRGAGAEQMDIYDIAAHLDGSPHGSPVATYHSLGTIPGFTGSSLPNECAACLSFTTTFYSLAAEHGPTASIPSTDEAIDQGAPATHTGKTRPRASHRWRVYLGPLTTAALDADTSGNEILSASYVSAVIAAYNTLKAAVITNGWTHEVWSRRTAATYTSGSGWMDNRVDSQRRRQTAPTVRTVF
jgi:hypothetical protein